MNTSLLIATADRPAELKATLLALAECRLPEGSFEVVVADNGADAETELVCHTADTRLNVLHLRVTKRGKAIALNQAIEVAAGDFFVFTDDDVTFDGDWLVELARASEEAPNHVLFGGRVTPVWPDDCPARLRGSRYVAPLYTLLDLGDEPGPKPGFRPFGPNMAVRRSVFDGGMRFDPELGPGSPSGLTLGDETDLARQLDAVGETAVYVPGSQVYHQVRSHQLALGWQFRRGVMYGRLLRHIDGDTGPRGGAIRSLAAVMGYGLLGRRRAAFDRLMDAAVAKGRSK